MSPLQKHKLRPGLMACLCLWMVIPPLRATPSIARQWNEEILSAIRLNVPNPPGHARNLFHLAVAMYNAWAAYDATAVGYIYNEKISPLPTDANQLQADREKAISFAAYRVLRSRFGLVDPNVPGGSGNAISVASFDAKITSLYGAGADMDGQAAVTVGTTPMDLGRRIGQAILTWGGGDGFPVPVKDNNGNVVPSTNTVTNQANRDYPQPYNTSINPNLASSLALSVLGTNMSGISNMPLGFGIPSGTNPNFWQPLDLATSVTQNGLPIPGGPQGFVGVQSLGTTPFSLTRTDPNKPWLDPFGGPSRLSVTGAPSPTDAGYKSGALAVIRASSQLNDSQVVNICPGAIGNNPLGSDSGIGHPLNPVTSQPFPANHVARGDYARVLAEFWADGPSSETPPGHWHVLANEVADHPLTVKKIRGIGPTLDDLEWGVKMYFAVSAATHDSACAAWALKRYYSGPRPITMIRYMGSLGQSTNPAGSAYNAQGLPLEMDVVEVITPATTGTFGKHNKIWDVSSGTEKQGTTLINKIAVRSWPGEHANNPPAPGVATHQSPVRWMLAKDWLPFQRKFFNTPAFPGYVSGHSSFSRAAAEVLTLLTGSNYFPGGFHHHTIAANSLQIDLGPSAPVDLQWCTYYDAADQAGQSRRWGGIHPSEDDYHGRIIGSYAGTSAFTLAEKYWTGTIENEIIAATIVSLAPTSVKVSWNSTRGMYHRVQTSTDLSSPWTNATASTITYATQGSFTDTNAVPGRKFYRIQRSLAPLP